MILSCATHNYFGDLWRFVSYALWMSERRNEPLGIVIKEDRRHDALEIAGAINSQGSIYLAERADTSITMEHVWPRPHMPTKIRWAANSAGPIGYRFDCFVSPAAKSPPAEHIEGFLSDCRRRQIRTVHLSRDLSITELIAAAASCRFCICPNTGLNQLLYSVSVPTYVVQYATRPDELERWDLSAARRLKDLPAFRFC